MPKFAKGRSGNPAGRPPGLTRAGELRQAVADALPEVLATVVEAAKGGDVAAARLLLERALPAVKPIELPVELALPADTTLTAKAEAIIQSAAAGQIAPAQAAQLVAGLGVLARLREADEIEQRITLLEANSLESRKGLSG